MSDKRYSIIADRLDRCIICGSYLDVEKHETDFGTANRKLSIKYGLVVPLCYKHHRGTYGVHGREGSKLNKKLKELGQKAFEYHYPDLNYSDIFGENRIED